MKHCRPTMMLLVASLAAASCGGDSGHSADVPVEQPIVVAGHEVQVFQESGVNEHVEGEVTYQQTPPVVGPHSVVPAPCGLHAEEIPEENLVHTLEHGAIGVLFDPNLAPSEIRKIERFARRSTEPVFSAPSAQLEADIAVISWGRMMNLETFDETATSAFAERFAGRPLKGWSDVPTSSVSRSFVGRNHAAVRPMTNKDQA